MNRVTCEGFGTTDDGVPAFVFRAKLVDQGSLDGKFKFGFALAKIGSDELSFALQSPRGILARWGHDDSKQIVAALAEHQEYKALVNYENTTIDRGDAVEVVILGRVVGEDFDWVEHVQLPQPHRENIAEMEDYFDELSGEKR